MISGIVIVKNEEKRIRACLESLKWTDEIIVVDNGSTDQSAEIAKKYTQHVIKHVSDDFSEIRNIGARKASGDWLLYVDADERVTAGLAGEVNELTKSEEFSAYAISRKNIIFGEEKSYGPFWPDWVIRFLKKSDFEKWEGNIHEQPKFSGKLGYTKNSFVHLTHRDLDQIVLKSLEWSKIDAKLRLESNHPQMSGWRFLRILITELFNQGVVRKGFFSGTVGMMDSLLQTFSLVMSYIRLWEMQRSESLNETYDKIDKELVDSKFVINK